jgi:hypothetical protein
VCCTAYFVMHSASICCYHLGITCLLFATIFYVLLICSWSEKSGFLILTTSWTKNCIAKTRNFFLGFFACVCLCFLFSFLLSFFKPPSALFSFFWCFFLCLYFFRPSSFLSSSLSPVFFPSFLSPFYLCFSCSSDCVLLWEHVTLYISTSACPWSKSITLLLRHISENHTILLFQR